jgi:hypothetical protein
MKTCHSCGPINNEEDFNRLPRFWVFNNQPAGRRVPLFWNFITRAEKTKPFVK